MALLIGQLPRRQETGCNNVHFSRTLRLFLVMLVATKTKYFPQDFRKRSSHINGNKLDIFNETTGHLQVGLVAGYFSYDFGTACSWKPCIFNRDILQLWFVWADRSRPDKTRSSPNYIWNMSQRLVENTWKWFMRLNLPLVSTSYEYVNIV